MSLPALKKIVLWGAACLLLLLAGYVYYAFNPADNPLFPQCPFHHLTGLKCPGCGSQRALHALLHGDWHAAFRHNALLLISLPLLLLLGYAELCRTQRPSLYIRLHTRLLTFLCLAVLLLWWICRNIFGI